MRFDDDFSHVADLDEAPVPPREAKAVRSDDGARVDGHARTDLRALADHDVGPDDRVFAQSSPRPNVDAGVNDGSGPDRHPVSHEDEGANRNALPDFRRVGDLRLRIDSGDRPRPLGWIEEINEPIDIQERIAH
jgi:hypothetical protein